LECDDIRHEAETREEDDESDTGVDEYGFSLFDTLLVPC
jgi:hypothetical protein